MATGALTEQVAENLESASVVARRLDPRVAGFLLVGAGVGAVVGFYLGYRLTRKKVHAEAMAEADEAISDMAEHYRRKTLALAAEDKDSPEEIIKERGYSQLMEQVVEKPEQETTPVRPLRAPVPVEEPAPLGVVEEDNFEWDYAVENSKRNPRLPFVIHEDEFNKELPAYSKVSYHYYPVDNVLADEDNSIIENVEEIIGAETLYRFGHGTDDPDLVYIRNNKLTLQAEIIRLPDRSYEEDVVGLEHHVEPN